MNKETIFESLIKEPVTHIQLVRYAGASGDFNPIHTVVPFAEEAGLGGVIAHGMLIMGFVGQAIGQWVSVDDLRSYKARFKAMTRPGERITVNGQILQENADYFTCTAEAVNDQGEVKLVAEFTVKK